MMKKTTEARLARVHHIEGQTLITCVVNGQRLAHLTTDVGHDALSAHAKELERLRALCRDEVLATG